MIEAIQGDKNTLTFVVGDLRVGHANYPTFKLIINGVSLRVKSCGHLCWMMRDSCCTCSDNMYRRCLVCKQR